MCFFPPSCCLLFGCVVDNLNVLVLHTAYLGCLLTGALAPHALMVLALAAYASYVVNATQYVLKLRRARIGRTAEAVA